MMKTTAMDPIVSEQCHPEGFHRCSGLLVLPTARKPLVTCACWCHFSQPLPFSWEEAQAMAVETARHVYSL